MRAWTLLLGGLVVWTAHFLALYGIASIFPGTTIANWLVLPLTLVAVAALIFLLRRSVVQMASRDSLDRWMGRLATLGAAISLLAVVWQAIPALAR